MDGKTWRANFWKEREGKTEGKKKWWHNRDGKTWRVKHGG